MRRVLLAAAIVIALPVSTRARRRSLQLGTAPQGGDGAEHAAALLCAAAHRRQQQRHPRRRLARQRQDRQLHRPADAQTGWTVKKQPFEFPFFQELADPVFERTAPTPHTYTRDTEFQTMDYSGSGDVTGAVVPVDVTVPMDPNAPASTSNSGCEAADFAGFPAGAIALVQRGTCTSSSRRRTPRRRARPRDRVQRGPAGPQRRRGRHARRAGRRSPSSAPRTRRRRAGRACTATARRPPRTSRRARISETRTTYNVIADSPFGDPDRTVVVSAHNDSVVAGPGINDDGSGHRDGPRARQQPRQERPVCRATTCGSCGSAPRSTACSARSYYVDQLTDAQKLKIIAMLDFDMVASPNWARQVYDGDGSDDGQPVRAGRLGLHREPVHRLVRRPGSGARADPVRRPLGLRRRSPTPASRPAASSPAPRSSRPQRSSRCSAAPSVSRSTRATTRRATRSTTST